MKALRRLRPTLWVELSLAAAWIALVFGSLLQLDGSASGDSAWSGSSFWVCMTDVSGAGSGMAGSPESLVSAGPSSALAATLLMPALMAMAMMLPPAMPTIQHVALNSLYWRRRRAVLEFAVTFLGVWVAYSLLLLGVLGSSGVTSASLAPAAALAIAAVWQLTPAKRRALQACHLTRPLPPKGWRATAGVADFGLRNGLACLASCWAMMLTTAFVGLPKLAWMATLTAMITAERLSLKPRRACTRIGAVLAAAAIVAAALALV